MMNDDVKIWLCLSSLMNDEVKIDKQTNSAKEEVDSSLRREGLMGDRSWLLDYGREERGIRVC